MWVGIRHYRIPKNTKNQNKKRENYKARARENIYLPTARTHIEAAIIQMVTSEAQTDKSNLALFFPLVLFDNQYYYTGCM